MPSRRPKALNLGPAIRLTAGLLALFWALEAADQWLLGEALDAYGIRPKSRDGLWGILFAPFLHGGFGHLGANSMPFLVLGTLVALGGRLEFLEVSLVIVFLGGLGTWLCSPAGTVHIGASGVIFGYFGFLMARGLLELDLRAILIAIGVGFLYGGMIWGVLPSQPEVSWQGHLFGFLGGAVFAWARQGRHRSSPARSQRDRRRHG